MTRAPARPHPPMRTAGYCTGDEALRPARSLRTRQVFSRSPLPFHRGRTGRKATVQLTTSVRHRFASARRSLPCLGFASLAAHRRRPSQSIRFGHRGEGLPIRSGGTGTQQQFDLGATLLATDGVWDRSKHLVHGICLCVTEPVSIAD